MSVALPYAALALDLDGTLLNADARIAPPCRDAIQALRRRDVAVFILTGRMQGSAEPFWRELDLDTPLVSCNGARIEVPGETPVAHLRLPPGLALRAEELADKHGWQLNHYIGDEVLSSRDNDRFRWYTDNYGASWRVLPLEEILALSPSTKLLAIVDESELQDAHRIAAACFQDVAYVTTSSRRFIEILPIGVDKGRALLRLAEWAGIPPERWVAVGDGMNDQEMLEAALFGSAVSDSEPGLLPFADRVIPPLSDGGMDALLATFPDD